MSSSEADITVRLRDAIIALKKVRSERDALLQAKREPIAVIGMACRFPGGATSPEAFWRALEAQTDAVSEVPPERWSLGPLDDGATEPLVRASRWGAFLRDVDLFEPQFFGISPREAASMDPQQRLLLEVAWEALERAGVVPERLTATRTGIFVGMTMNDYAQLNGSFHPDLQDVYTATGIGHCFLAGRLSYVLGTQGPSVTLDTACSSSLVATHLACQSLRSGESDLALAGGANLMLSPATTSLIAKTGALSPDGRCRTFDAQASGTVRGEGCGVVVLKRLSDAQRDRDPILAVIRGSAVNQDGRSTGMTAPNILAQQAMLRQALESAGVSAADIGYVEAHGTGTPLGDPIELEALKEVLGNPRTDGYACVLGAVKTNLGHLEAAAGMAGIQKAILALRNQAIPANLNFKTLNPRIDLRDTPFVIPTSKTPWPVSGRSRIAGVSSFGLSGTNAHLVLEEAARYELAPAVSVERSSYLVPLSAKSRGALTALASAYQEHLAPGGDEPLRDIAYTASVRRSHHEHRLSVVARSKEDLAASLDAFARGELPAGGTLGRAGPEGPPKLVFVFAGQGSQWIGMGRELAAEEPAFRSALEACDAAIRREAGFSVMDELSADEARSRIREINVVQPMLFSMAVALAALWRSWGVEPSAVIGHSNGEIAAAHVAGVLSLDHAVQIICRRSMLLRRLSGRGAMAFVALSMAEAQAAIAGYEDRLSVAVSNGPRATVLSGDPAAMSEVLAKLEQNMVFCRKVNSDVAGHCPVVDPLRDDLLAALKELAPRKASINMVSTVLGRAVEGPELAASYWADNMRRPVLFAQAVTKIAAEGRAVFLELSPHPILLTPIEETLSGGGLDGIAVCSLRRGVADRRSLLEALGALHAHGFAVDFARQHPDGGRVVGLPTYPWQRRRYWTDAPVRQATSALPVPERRAAGDAAGEALYEVSWREHAAPRPDIAVGANPRRWLILADKGGTGDALAAALRGRGDTCELVPRDEGDSLDGRLCAALEGGDALHGVVHLWSLDAPSDDAAAPDERDAPELPLCASVVELLPRLAERHASARLWLVTRNAQPAGDAPVSAVQAPLWGLGRVIALEHPDLWGGLIDLGGQPSDAQVERLVDALAGLDDEDQIALRGDRRFVARFAPARLPADAAAPRVRPDRTYLVTGGLTGLGLFAAQWLVARGAKHLVLTGRTALPERARWNEPSSDAEKARIDAVRALEAQGATVHVCAVDVADLGAMASVIEGLEHPLCGVIHSAGTNVVEPLAAPSAVQALRDVFRAKVLGARVLHRLTKALPLDVFVMFSSAAAIWGSKKQGHYSAANHFMDALAHVRRAQGLPALSLNLGAVAGGGMLTRDLEGSLRSIGMTLMKPELMNEAMQRALAAGVVQCTLAQVDWRVFKPIYEAQRSRPLLRDIPLERATDRSAEPSDADRRSTLLEAIATADRDQKKGIVASFLHGIVSAVLRVGRAEIDIHAPLFSYGMDSFMTLDLRKRIDVALGVKISAAEIWSIGRIDKLAELIAERLGDHAVSRSTAEPEGGLGEAASVTASDTAGPERAIVVPRKLADPKARLICFPYAGGGASVYSEWPNDLAPGVELCIVAPPGRHGRAAEPIPETVGELVADLVQALLPYLDRPFALFGHCFGAIVMFEVARELCTTHGRRPIHIFASGAPTPSKYLPPKLTLGGRDRIVELLRLTGFARDEVLDDKEALDELLGPVLGDFDMAARYRHVRSSPLDVPITTFAATDDLFVAPEVVEEWRVETSAATSKHVYSGEHYFLFQERASIQRIVNEELLNHLAVLEGQRRAERSDASPRQEPPAALEAPRPPRASERRRSPGLELSRRSPAAAGLLVCFPCAGGDAALFRAWAEALPREIDVGAVELPGASGETPFGHIHAMVDWLTPVLVEHLNRPFSFFGHDLGALLMFEVARRLRTGGHRLPQNLFVSASMAPHLFNAPQIHRLPKAKFLGALRTLGAAVYDDEAERRLRADFGAMVSYACAPEPPLDVPITAFIGDRDAFVSQEGLRAWRELTTSTYRHCVVSGDHAFIREKHPPVLPYIMEAMALRHAVSEQDGSRRSL